MSLRNLTRGLFQLAMHRRFYSSIQQQVFTRKLVLNNQRFTSVRSFSSIQTNENVYKDLNQFLDKEIQLERVTQ
ncbi:unnamed protein product, partial [Rotaria magnacalcarata]